MAAKAESALERMSATDLDTLRLSCQIMAHKAALAELPRAEMFFTTLEAETAAEGAARRQRGRRGEEVIDPWRTAPLTPGDRAAIAAYLELLAGNEALSPAVRAYAQGLITAGRLW